MSLIRPEQLTSHSTTSLPLTPPAGETAATLILKAAGEDLHREGLLQTPARFRKAMGELTEGYRLTPADVIGQGVFQAEGRGLVSVREVEFYSLCEHHLLPFWGKASVAYYPNEKIVGLSKIPRILDVFARRFQVQERLTRQIAEALHEALSPRAVAVRIQASHLCMMMRGVEKQKSDTVTEFEIGVNDLTATEQNRLWESLK